MFISIGKHLYRFILKKREHSKGLQPILEVADLAHAPCICKPAQLLGENFTKWYYSSTIGGWLIYLKQFMEIKAKAVVKKKEYIREYDDDVCKHMQHGLLFYTPCLTKHSNNLFNASPCTY